MQIVCAHFVDQLAKAFDDVSEVVRVGPCADKLWNKDLLHEMLGKGAEDIRTVVTKRSKARRGCGQSQLRIQEALQDELGELLHFVGCVIAKPAQRIRNAEDEVCALESHCHKAITYGSLLCDWCDQFLDQENDVLYLAKLGRLDAPG